MLGRWLPPANQMIRFLYALIVLDTNLITQDRIKAWERALSKLIGTEVGLTAPIARAYLYDERFKDNLSVRAVNAEGGRVWYKILNCLAFYPGCTGGFSFFC